jgi:hypothetical protein
MDATWRLHFRDVRSPHDIRCHLERALLAVMPPVMEEGRLVGRTRIRVTGAEYKIQFTFEAARPRDNAYTLEVTASWAHLPPATHDYFQRSSENWFNLWTQGFHPAAPATREDGFAETYLERCAHTLAAESHLQTVESLQQEIVAALKRGATFATSHKEGGTRIRWHRDRFIRSDHGESDTVEAFPKEEAFLKFLRRFYDSDTTRNHHPDPLPEPDVWRLILRLLRPAS